MAMNTKQWAVLWAISFVAAFAVAKLVGHWYGAAQEPLAFLVSVTGVPLLVLARRILSQKGA